MRERRQRTVEVEFTGATLRAWMARKSDIKTDLTLEVDGDTVSPEAFLRSVRAFFTALEEITTKIGGRKDAVEWNVMVRQGSNLVGIEPVPGYEPVIVGQILTALSSGAVVIEDRAELPEHFSDRAVRAFKDLGEVAGEHDARVRLWVRKEPHAITKNTSIHVSTLDRSAYTDYGSIEGKLETVTDRSRLHFIVRDNLTGEGVRCYIPENLIDLAMSSFRRRVEVYGLIRYRKDGKSQSIQVDEIVTFPPREALPSYRDVKGILRGRT